MTEETNKQNVLIVDDEPGNIRILMELLSANYQIRVATNGETALEIAMSKNPPDLILLDIMMPGMDGYEVCKRLKENSSTHRIPVIFLTGKATEEDEIKGFETGAVDYITKPFSAVIVATRVKTALELKRHRDFLEKMLHARVKMT
jgi:putative two-component system response regulator